MSDTMTVSELGDASGRPARASKAEIAAARRAQREVFAKHYAATGNAAASFRAARPERAASITPQRCGILGYQLRQYPEVEAMIARFRAELGKPADLPPGHGLTKQQARFCDQIADGMDPEAAWSASYASTWAAPKDRRQGAQRLLAMPMVQQQIAALGRVGGAAPDVPDQVPAASDSVRSEPALATLPPNVTRLRPATTRKPPTAAVSHDAAIAEARAFAALPDRAGRQRQSPDDLTALKMLEAVAANVAAPADVRAIAQRQLLALLALWVGAECSE